MFEAPQVKNNTVKAENQLAKSEVVQHSRDDGAAIRVLFIGNSITKHGVKAEIGWHHDWGMAASSEDKDYVHQTVSLLKERYGTVDFMIAQLANWEQQYPTETDKLKDTYRSATEYPADIVVVRIGENVIGDMMDEIDCKPYFEKMIKLFVTESCKQVVVTDNFWRRDKLDNMLHQICDEQGYTFCKISDLYEDPKTMALGLFEHEGVALHPCDYGMELIAKRIVEKITV